MTRLLKTGDKIRFTGDNKSDTIFTVGDEGDDIPPIFDSEGVLYRYLCRDRDKSSYDWEWVDETDAINPSYYQFPGGVQVKDITKHLGFLPGSAIKYIARAGRKNPDKHIEDLRKAIECIEEEIERIENA